MNDKPFEIIVLGPPVSGKGTQAKLLSETFEIPHISTGTILHGIKSDASHPRNQEVAEYMDSGKLVPSELVNQLVKDRINQEDCQIGFLLDGYPRTMEQAQVIDQAADLDYVFLIQVSDETVIERISGRRVCQNGHTWHIKFSPTKVEGVCDTCGQPLFQRDDDKADVVRQRLNVYHENMTPIITYFRDKGKLLEIDGEQNIDKVFQQMVHHLVYDLRQKNLNNGQN